MSQYVVKDKPALVKINDTINEYFYKEEPFALSRIGNMEGYFLDCINKQEMPLQEFFHWLSLTSGVFPVDMDYLVNTWAPINQMSMKYSDILGFVDISGHVKANKNFNDLYCANKPTFFGVDDILVLDPGYLVNKDIVDVTCDNPWTRNLAGKRVLVVSAFVDSIYEQWKNIDKIWGDKRKDIVPFELAGVVRSPFHPAMDDRQKIGWTSWDKVLDSLCYDIDGYDYDVLLISAGAWAPPLAIHAKMRGKIGITLCGTLQLFFGILGARWTGKNPAYNAWSKMYNEHWEYPRDIDLPKRKDVFDKFENAYWK